MVLIVAPNEAANVVQTLLRTLPQLHLLASSREALGVEGETLYRVPSLTMPGADGQATPADVAASESAQLFVDRARSVAPAFTLTEHNVAAVAQVCRRLDGIPLAIELAAARLTALSIEELARRGYFSRTITAPELSREAQNVFVVRFLSQRHEASTRTRHRLQYGRIARAHSMKPAGCHHTNLHEGREDGEDGSWERRVGGAALGEPAPDPRPVSATGRLKISCNISRMARPAPVSPADR